MRRKKDTIPPGYGRLLDAWIPPVHAGEALGCLATTFTFHPSFFETECLSRMLQLESDPDDNTAQYLLEREEKMAQMMSATVVVDQSHARGSRSLRWDLIPFRASDGILHAKLSILLWQHHARVIVGSANLTENGYRQNLEVFTVWDFSRDGGWPVELFESARSYAVDVLAHCRSRNPGTSPALDRAEALLKTARARVSAWPSTSSRIRSVLVPLSPKTSSVFDQIQDRWPGNSRADTLKVLSPFFDPSEVNHPGLEAWSLLRKRGRKQVHYSVTTEEIDAAGKIQVNAPSSLSDSVPASLDDARLRFDRIKGLDGRPLHAKCLRLEGGGHFLHLVGSSNFTSAGLGLKKGGHQNWELNVVSWAKLDSSGDQKAHDAAWPLLEREPLDPNKVNWQPVDSYEDESDPDVALLPAWCGSAVFYLGEKGESTLELNFAGKPPGHWSIRDESQQTVILDTRTWQASGSRMITKREWKELRPPTELGVRWGESLIEARWPVEVRTFADLPPPLELRDLSLEQLLEILTSALPLHRCLSRNDAEGN